MEDDGPLFKAQIGKRQAQNRPNLSPEERLAWLRGFLRNNKVFLPHEYVEVLTHCRRVSEVWFLVPVLLLSGWKKDGNQSLNNGIYRLTVKGSIAGYTVDFVFEDLLRQSTSAIEIKRADEYLPGKARAARLRLQQIKNRVDKLFIVPTQEARTWGKRFRKDLLQEQLRRASEFSNNRTGGTPHVSYGSDLAYDVSGMPLEDRIPLLRNWLGSREHEVGEPLIHLLAQCDRAGELLFALELFQIPECVGDDDGCTIANLYRLRVRPMIHGFTVSFVVEPISSKANRSRVAIEINPPKYYQQDQTKAAEQDQTLLSVGIPTNRVAADQARQLGYRWRQMILVDVHT